MPTDVSWGHSYRRSLTGAGPKSVPAQHWRRTIVFFRDSRRLGGDKPTDNLDRVAFARHQIPIAPFPGIVIRTTSTTHAECQDSYSERDSGDTTPARREPYRPGESVFWVGDGACPPRVYAPSLTQVADQAASVVAALYARTSPIADAEL